MAGAKVDAALVTETEKAIKQFKEVYVGDLVRALNEDPNVSTTSAKLLTEQVALVKKYQANPELLGFKTIIQAISDTMAVAERAADGDKFVLPRLIDGASSGDTFRSACLDI